jgi:DHA1 family bicyclomycin/chloramphenicol resistance-like MFS transporter
MIVLAVIFASLGLQIAGYFYQGNFMLLGTILAVLIAMVAITHLFVLRNHALIMFSQAGNEIKIPQC